MYLFSYACMHGLFLYMYVWTLLRCVVHLTITLDHWFPLLPSCDASFLVCSLSSCVFPQVSKGHTHSYFHVLEPFMHLPWLVMLVTPLLPTRTSYLSLHQTTVKEILYDPLLGFLHQTVWCLVGTSYQRDPLTCWWVQHCQQNPKSSRNGLWRKMIGKTCTKHCWANNDWRKA